MPIGSVQQSGFTYLAVIFMVAVTGIVLAANGALWSAVKRSEDSEQLEFVGDQMRRAIGSYYEQSPGSVKVYPKRLEDLLKDDRTAVPRHHLRQIYRDPFTDNTDWKLIQAPEGNVMGIASSSNDLPGTSRREFVYRPIAETGFSPRR